MSRIEVYIYQIRKAIQRRIKDARIEVYKDHLAGCDECQGGYHCMCDEGVKLLNKCKRLKC